LTEKKLSRRARRELHFGRAACGDSIHRDKDMLTPQEEALASARKVPLL